MDLNLNKKVLEDLMYLKENWNKEIGEVTIRHTSHILRSLLVENDLIKVKNALNVQLRIQLSEQMNLTNNKQDYKFYMPSEATFANKPQIKNFQIINRILSKNEIEQFHKQIQNERINLVQISKFCKAIAFLIDGIQITKDELIKYVCNKIGGVHYDTKRNDKILDKKYKLLDSINNSMEVHSSNPVYSATQSIGQNIVNSPDFDNFISKLQENQPYDWRKNYKTLESLSKNSNYD